MFFNGQLYLIIKIMLLDYGNIIMKHFLLTIGMQNNKLCQFVLFKKKI